MSTQVSGLQLTPDPDLLQLTPCLCVVSGSRTSGRSLSLSLTAISALSTRRSSPVSLRCQEMSGLWVFMTWMFNLPKSSGVSPHSLHPSFLFRNHLFSGCLAHFLKGRIPEENGQGTTRQVTTMFLRKPSPVSLPVTWSEPT